MKQTIEVAVLGLLLAFTSTVAMGQAVADYVTDLTAMPEISAAAGDAVARTMPDFLMKAIPFMLALMVVCRGLSEALLAVADRFGGDKTRKVASLLGQVSGLAGIVLAYVGVGQPTKLTMAKAEKIAAKDLGITNDGTSKPAA